MTVSPVLATWIIMKPPPPTPADCGSTTFSAYAMATAASMALPPASSTCAPASAPCGLATATTPWRNAWPAKDGALPLATACAGRFGPGTPIVACGWDQLAAQPITVAATTANAVVNVRVQLILPPLFYAGRQPIVRFRL